MNIELQGIDIVAIICVLSFSGLIYSGLDGSLPLLLSTIVGYYFGRKSVQDALQAVKGAQSKP